MTDSEKIASLEARLLDVTARLDQIDNKKQVGFYEIPENDFDPRIPLAQEVSSSFTQSAKRTDVQVSWSNPDPGRIERFELWAENVTGQSKEPYLVASVDNSPASFSLEADQDTAVSVFIRTITRDGLSSTLRGSPAIGVSIVQQPLGASDIANGSIGDSKLDRVTDPIVIDTADIANAAIGTAQIANLAVNNAKINDLAATKITAGTLAAGVILASNIAATQISAGTLAAGVILASNIAASQISAGTMTAVNVSAGTFSLTAGGQDLTINGSDGFRSENTTLNTYGSLNGGQLVLGDTDVNNLVTAAAESIALTNSSTNTVGLFANNTFDLGQADSGYLAINNSSGTNRVVLGVDSAGDGQIQLDGHLSIDEIANTPANPTSSAEARIYVKGDNFVIQFNDAGTVRYKYLDLTGTGVTWTHSTTAP